MKMNDIDKFIIENRDSFDSEIPDSGHEIRLMAKIMKSQKTDNRRKHFFYLKIAASILILISISTLLLIHFAQVKYKSINQINLTVYNIEFNETRDYYRDQINIQIAQIQTMNYIDPKQKESVFNELNSMDNNFRQLQIELNDNPFDERIMQAMIEHYQIKLNAINQIIESYSISQINSKIHRNENSI